MCWRERLRGFGEGARAVRYRGRRWLMRKQTYAGGRVQKLYAEALDGSDVVSLNAYETASGMLLKPCEMSPEKVIAFIEGVEI